jgi:hypothetical protein
VKWLVKLIDEDGVASLNSGRRAEKTQGRAKRFATIALSVYAPRITWVKIIVPLLSLPVPLSFLHEPKKTYWLFACLAAVLIFFGVYFYRFALIRQRWLDKHQVDEFGTCNASPDDLYEVPSD